ncbi:helix-turn-helix domain-containing protein [Aquimarina algiphila]|uniref:Helix-turn-helix transcriptional regulator n=1 Tax=Aquimarina algiphila TaxID=2047982 RepID=A0A554VEE2_9FLAO|nr:AraC family transcriptional regulator [Aquimarina algiphila]TSE05369.1 helix-turn-helix transcriptional regulator [Aquimarina algiphila]
MEYYFKEEKLYKDPSLNISSCASIFKVSTKELIDYFKITNKGVFKDYINGLRVSEFKQLLQNEKFSNYDLVGLAKECGFKSKSTFFRVFKGLEGFTPNEYKKKANR